MRLLSGARRWARPLSLGLALSGAGCPGLASAQSLDWTGEAGVSAWTSNRQLDDRQGVAVGRLKLGADLALGEDWRGHGEAWALSDGGRQGPWAGLKEAYVEWRTAPCRPSLGKRLVAWGKTDVVTPTDQLSPTDLTRLVGKETEQRDGVIGLHGRCALGPGQLSWHLLDRFEASRVPVAAQAGVTVVEIRGQALRATRALRYEVSGDGLDWAVSAIDGHDLLPTVALRSADAQGLVWQLQASRMRLLGVDAATTFGDWVLRGELAAVDYPGQPAASLGQTAAIRLPYTQWVLGAERGLGDRESLTVQLLGRHQRGEVQPLTPLAAQLQQAQGLLSSALDRHQLGLTLRYARPFDESRGEAEALLVLSRPRADWFLRLRSQHSLSDTLKLSLGLDLLRGPSDSVLGQLRRNSLAFAEVSVAW